MKLTMGERFNIRFNRKIKLEFHGARLTSDGGLLAYRELDEALGLFKSVTTVMSDRRTGRNIQHNMINLAVHFNELLFNATRSTGISSPWIFKEKQRISKKIVTY